MKTQMKRMLIVTFAMLALTACASNPIGVKKPKWFLTDWNKPHEAYYLSLNQIAIGDDKAKVIEVYGNKYRVKSISNDQELWVFKSYRATAMSDPEDIDAPFFNKVDKLVYVEFSNGRVISKREELLGR